jgi:hypothetical protein
MHRVFLPVEMASRRMNPKERIGTVAISGADRPPYPVRLLEPQFSAPFLMNIHKFWEFSSNLTKSAGTLCSP